MMGYPLKYSYISPFILEIYWPEDICEEILLDILYVKKILKAKWENDLKDMVMGYHCLSLHFKFPLNYSAVLSDIEESRTEGRFPLLSERKRWHIPVCYDLVFGKDLLSIAKASDQTIEKIVEIHSETTYLLYFYGFMPGFMYLGGLSEKLHTPRKPVPDRKVEKGSLAIGGKQTGIYPMESPGGWWVIGKTPVNIFNLRSKDIVLAQPGDEIIFEPIDIALFDHIQEQEAKGGYALKREFIYG